MKENGTETCSMETLASSASDIQGKSEYAGVINHCRLNQLLERAAQVLGQIFCNRWALYIKNVRNGECSGEWQNGYLCGGKLAKACKNVPSKMVKILREGNCELWDVTMMNCAIQTISNAMRAAGFQNAEFKDQDRLIDKIRNLRNDIAHGKPELTDEEFTKYWTKLAEAMISLGDIPAELEELKEKLMKMSFADVKPTDTIESRALKLKEEANNLFKDKKYAEAVDVYSKILEFSGVSPENQATIYSNRSAAYLLLDTETSRAMALRDAKFAVKLWPCWWRGYYRLGRAYFESQKWEKANSALNKAFALNPTSKDVKDELSKLRLKVGIMSRKEHLLPGHVPQDLEEQYKIIGERLGMSKKEIIKLTNEVMGTPVGDVLEGHRYRDGIGGVKRDYAKAAIMYSKAAKKGNPEAMYNLALLHQNGDGVKLDFEQALYWLEKAATMNSKTPILEIGIAEAQHALGLKYNEGIGVDKNYRKAAEWYKKAVDNNFGPSGNNLGLLYKNGLGVERSSVKAFQHFLFSSKRDDTSAMQSLAACYFKAEGTGSTIPTEEDIQEGIKWLRRASSLGDHIATVELEKLMSCDPKTLQQGMFMESLNPFNKGAAEAEPLDQRQYSSDIQAAAKKGSATADRMLTIWKCMNTAMEAFKNGDNAKLVRELAKAIQLDYQTVTIPELFTNVLQERIKTYPDELDTIICHMRLRSRDPNLLDYVRECLQKFPTHEFLLEMLAICLITLEHLDEATDSLKHAMAIYPKSLRLLYAYCVAISDAKEPTKEMLQRYDAFLTLAPKDHEKVPAIHYRKAMYYMRTKDIENSLRAYEEGVTAEKKQLPCFLPYKDPRKDMLEKMYRFTKRNVNKADQADSSNSSTIERDNKDNHKQALIFTDPRRRILLTNQRELVADMHKNAKLPFKITTTVLKMQHSPKPPSLVSLKKIILSEMDTSKEAVYDGYVIELKVIDWPSVIEAVHMVVEDERGEVERLAIYNWPKSGKDTKELLKTFRPNRTLSIINPFMRLPADHYSHGSMIRVENPAYVVLGEYPPDNSCHCCGKECNVQKCGKCLVAQYCSKECQIHDWTEFQHKIVCKALKTYSACL
ncbi:sel1 repeat domain-containing protein [Ditylenchus destructor]|nr:sel1 repeat domain-containing protein [Ditylenchus destructor]